MLEALGGAALDRLADLFGAGPADNDAQSGDLFGEYRLLARLGRGGFADAWTATHLHDGGQFVIKIFHRSASDAAAAVEEAALRRLRGVAGVASLVDSGSHRDRPFLVLQHVDGVPLADLVEQYSTGPPGAAVGLLLQLLTALEAIHACRDDRERPLVHGDVTPHNILIDSAGAPVLIDFNSAFRQSDSLRESETTAHSLPNRPLGVSANYRVPEVMLGDASGISADLYQIGLLAFELFTGQRFTAVYKESGSTGVRKALANCVDGRLASFVAQATEWEPASRYASARQMRTALEQAIGRRFQLTAMRKIWLAAAVAAVALLAMLGPNRPARTKPGRSARDAHASSQAAADPQQPGDAYHEAAELCHQYLDLSAMPRLSALELTRLKANQSQEALAACRHWQRVYGPQAFAADRTEELARWLENAQSPREVEWTLAGASPLGADVEVVLRQGDRITHRRPLSVEHEREVRSWRWRAKLRMHEAVSFEIHDPSGAILRAVPWVLLQGLDGPPRPDRLTMHLDARPLRIVGEVQVFPPLQPPPVSRTR